MNHRMLLYFSLAVLPSLLELEAAPTTPWLWWKWIGKGLVQGLVAVKAYQSNPEQAMPPPQKLMFKKEPVMPKLKPAHK